MQVSLLRKCNSVTGSGSMDYANDESAVHACKVGSQDGQNLLARMEADEHRRRMLIHNPSVLVRVS